MELLIKYLDYEVDNRGATKPAAKSKIVEAVVLDYGGFDEHCRDILDEHCRDIFKHGFSLGKMETIRIAPGAILSITQVKRTK